MSRVFRTPRLFRWRPTKEPWRIRAPVVAGRDGWSACVRK